MSKTGTLKEGPARDHYRDLIAQDARQQRKSKKAKKQKKKLALINLSGPLVHGPSGGDELQLDLKKAHLGGFSALA